VRAAQATADEAAAALDEAERAVGGVAEQRQFLRRRISHLERELGEARAADAQLTREAKQAERSKDAAARRLATAKRQLDQARREAGRAE
jgi:chromosome segregation ATPase